MHLTAREQQQIDSAILAHSQWLTRLRVAIEDGASQFDPDIVMTDNRCELGKWLYEEFPRSERNTEAFERIRQTHAAFHRNAAKILRLALNGQRDLALESMKVHGEFIALSTRLIALLKELRREQRREPGIH